MKLEQITAAVVKELKSSCGECSSEMIDNQFFVCYPESPSFLTYRARLEGTRETDSDSLISLIEEWVRGGASINVTGVLMTVDPHCSVAISSSNEPECSLSVDGSVKEDGQINTLGIVGGVVAVIIITIAIVFIVFLILKIHKGGVLKKKPAKKYVPYMTQKRSQHVKFSVGADMRQQLLEVMSSQPPMRPMGRQ